MVALASLSLGCGQDVPTPPDAPRNPAAAQPRVLHSADHSGWFEPAYSESHTSRDGRLLFWTVAGEPHLLDTGTGQRLASPAAARFAAQFGAGDLAFFEASPSGTRWLRLEVGESGPLPGAPSHRTAAWSPDGARVAWSERTADGQERLSVRGQRQPAETLELAGPARSLVWSDSGEQLFVLVQQSDGSSELLVRREGASLHPIRRGLDAPPFWSPMAFAEDPPRVIVALASPDPPVAAERHAPFSDRDLDLWAIHLDGTLHHVTGAPGADDYSPSVGAGQVTWTRNDVVQQVVRLPASGGPMEVVQPHGQLPVWSPDGSAIAFAVGPWRLADMALNLDAWMADIDGEGQAGPSRPLVVGWHEDFTPTWSPDGRWLAFHSHRAPNPVSAYSEGGSSDDVYVRRADDPAAPEVRVSDFGLEVGMADWSPDSRWLAFTSHSHDEHSPDGGTSSAWLVAIDPQSGEPVQRVEVRRPEGAAGVDRIIFGPRGEIALVTHDARHHKTLWVQAERGARQHTVTSFESSTLGDVDWSPNGNTLVFSGLAGERMALWAVDADPSRGDRSDTVRLLAFDPAADLLHPRFSADGQWLAASRVQWRKSLLSAPLTTAPSPVVAPDTASPAMKEPTLTSDTSQARPLLHPNTPRPRQRVAEPNRNHLRSRSNARSTLTHETIQRHPRTLAQWHETLRPKIFTTAEMIPADYDRLPAFEFRDESLGAISTRTGLSLLALLVPAAALLIWARRRARAHPIMA